MKVFVVICSKCGRGILGGSRAAIVDDIPLWWMAHPTIPGKMLEGPRCGGRIMRVERMPQIERLNREAIVPANEVEILDNG